METPKPHPHADAIKAWADGAKIQLKTESGEWVDVAANWPCWPANYEYRIKPEEPSNEPWKPKEGETYYFLVSTGAVEKERFQPSWPCDNARLEIGNSFRTKAEAEAAAGRVKAALKGEVGDKAMSREEADSAMRSAIGMCILADNNTSLEHENKALKNELETLKIRFENLHKAKEQLIANQSVIDGTPLTAGDYALIKAVREYPILEINRNDRKIAVVALKSNPLDDKKLKDALKQILENN